MRKRESWQHEWSDVVHSIRSNGATERFKMCKRQGCPWQMLSRKNSNRYRNGPDGEWMHSPKDCKGEQE